MQNSQINSLVQHLAEEKYNKKNIPEIIRSAIMDSEAYVLGERFIKAVELINEYIDGNYSYESKNRRIIFLVKECDMTVQDMVLELLICVCRSKKPQPIQSIISPLAYKLGYADIFDGVKTAAEVAAKCAEADLFNITPGKYTEEGVMLVTPIFGLDDETHQKIADCMYLPPMVVPPLEVTSNRGSGYLSMKNDSIILGKDNHHSGKQALDVLNLLNQTALSLDLDMLQFEEESSKPLDTPEKQANFERMRKSSQKVYQHILENGNQFYNTHKNDKRGRLYSQGYHVHIQSTDYKKSLISLSKKEVIQGAPKTV